ARLKFGNDAAVVADVEKGGADGPPVDVAISEIWPTVGVPTAFEILEMDFVDLGAKSANPILRVAVEHDVADVEPCTDPRAFEFGNVCGHVERTQQELVPDLFDGNDYFQFFGERKQFADLLLRARPRVAIRSAGVYDGRDQQDRIRAPKFCVMKGRAHAVHAFLDDGGIGRRKWIVPVRHVHDGINVDTGRCRGVLNLLGDAFVRSGQRLNDCEACVASEFEAVRVAQL